MLSIPEATDALRVALRKKGVKGHVQDTFDNLASCLVLLNSLSPSVQMIRKLCTVLRQPFLPLYNACLQPALQLSSSILSAILGKLCDAQMTEEESLCTAWDTTAEVILSGILDFLDQKDHDKTESGGAVWEVLYRVVCENFFLDPGREQPEFSVPLCLSAYSTLTEIATRQIAVRGALRQRAVLGGERLGAAISRARDYLLLEALLLLFARLLPPTHNTSQGKLKRTKFVKEVLGSPKLFKCSAGLLDVIQKTSGIQWDDIAAQIIDVLSRSDITYPQPFAIDEIYVCGRVFPQPLATDRLIMDRQAFLVNVVVENDDICESLQVPYSRIRAITLNNSEENLPKEKVSIIVYLTSPPLVANAEMKYPDANHLHAKFLLQNAAIGRFMEALRRRGVGKLSFLPLTRMDGKHKSISIGSGFKFANESSPIPPTASFEGKVKRVNQVYKTDIEDTNVFQAPLASHVANAGSLHTPNPRSPLKDENLVSDVYAPKVPEDISAAHKSPVLTQTTSKGSKLAQKPALSCLLVNSTRLFGGSDELSEISEFEASNNTRCEQVVTEASAPGNYELQSTRPRFDYLQKIQSITHPSERINEPSVPASKLAHDAGDALGSYEAGKPLLPSDSSMIGATSSTQIDISLELLPNSDTFPTAVGTDRLPIVCKDSISAGMLRKNGDESGPSDLGQTVTSAGKPRVKSSFARDELGQRATLTSSSFNTDQERSPYIEIEKDTSVTLKIAGNRRKRESIKFLSEPATGENDDECVLPRKKSRGDRLEDKVKSDATLLDILPVSRAKRYTKAIKRPSPSTDPIATDLGRSAALRPAFQGTRRSSRIKKRQMAAADGNKLNATRGKTGKVKQPVFQTVPDVERKKLVTASIHDTGAEIGHGTQPIRYLCPMPPMVTVSPPPRTNSQVPRAELGSAEDITLETPLGMPEGNDTIACAPNQPTSDKEPRKTLYFAPGAASDAAQLNQEYLRVENGENLHDRHPLPEVYTIDEVSGVPGVFEKLVSASLQETKNPLELSQPTTEMEHRTENVTIDLTRDESPPRENNKPCEASVNPVRSKVDIHPKIGTPDISDGIALGEPVLSPTPRNKRRSVTFASPIECVLDKEIKPGREVISSSPLEPAQSSHPLSPSESSTLSPLKIPGIANARHRSPSAVNPHVTLQNPRFSQSAICSYGLGDSTPDKLQASLHDETANEFGIQDIVEVLNEIQAVIIKGISDKLKNVRKGVRRNRDELIQQVLDELRAMVVENARYFNGLLRLEEDYYKHCKTITHCWEELIDCNDDIMAQFQDALKQHDQNILARVFPRSTIPMQPVFPRRRASAF